MKLLKDNSAVSRAEFAIVSVFTIVAFALASAVSFTNMFSSWFSSATGISDPFVASLGSSGLIWAVAVALASMLILMIKRNKR